MDPVGTVGRIVKLALTIKDAAGTVTQNRELCGEIRVRAVRVSALLSLLPAESAAALNDEPAMRGALEDLEASLQRALELVASCQETATACLLCKARKHAGRLRRAQDDISHSVMTVILTTNVQTILLLTRNPPPHPQPRPLDAEVVFAGSGSTDVGLVMPASADWLHSYAVSDQDDYIASGSSGERVQINNLVEPPSPPVLTLEAQRIHSLSDDSPFRSRISFQGRNDSMSLPDLWPNTSINDMSLPGNSLLPEPGLTKFNLSGLDAATHHFSDDNLIGRGTFADVYKGEFPNGLVVAVKKFRQPFQTSITLIRDRINLFSEFHHQNVVRFIGYALEESIYFLVEEYTSGGSLNDISASPIGWSSLFHIIQGTAYGLHYLHNQNLIHLDLKPSNILLDSDMNPKITNIGTATILGQGDDDAIRDVSTITGTLGYMAPEYIMGGTLSTKCDVYGFGIIILEIISSMCKSQPTRGLTSIQWAWAARSTKVSFDPSLYERSQLKGINRCTEIGLLCTQYKPEDRPTMSDVLGMINGKKKLPMAKKPRYIKGSS